MALLFPVVHPLQSGSPCEPCPDGSSITTPDKFLDFVPNIPPMNCGEMATMAPLVFQTGSDGCNLAQSLTTVCGCPRAEDSCTLCPDGTAVGEDFKDILLDIPTFISIFQGPQDFLPNCELLEGYLHSRSAEDGLCEYGQQTAGELCGCGPIVLGDDADNATTYDPGDFDTTTVMTLPPLEYTVVDLRIFGVRSEADVTLQRGIQRGSACLSILGTLLVLQDYLRNRKRWKKLYNQIVALMAIFDLMISIVRVILDDVYVFIGSNVGVTAGCKTQGWFMEFGMLTSLIFNASLSTCECHVSGITLCILLILVCIVLELTFFFPTDYLLVIVYCATDSSLSKWRKYLLALPPICGFIFACAALPWIWHGVGTVCFIPRPINTVVNYRPGWGPRIGLVIIPIVVVLVYTTFAMVRVYWFVRKTDTNASQWSFGRAASSVHSKTTTTPTGVDGGRRRSILQSVKSTLSSIRMKANTATSRLRREVAWQCLSYLFALYATWGFYVVVQVVAASDDFYFWNIYFFIVPLQGFMNAFVYFRPRLNRRWVDFREDRKRKKQNVAGDRQDRKQASEGGGAANPAQLSKIQQFFKSWVPCVCCTGCGSPDQSFADAEPAVDLVVLNSQERESQDTIDEEDGASPTDEVCLSNDRQDDASVAVQDDVNPLDLQDNVAHNDDDEEGVASPTGGGYLGHDAPDGGSIVLQDDEINTLDLPDNNIASNEAVEAQGMHLGESRESDAILQTEKKRRRSSLQMLAGALVGIDGTAWTQSAGCDSCVSEESEE